MLHAGNSEKIDFDPPFFIASKDGGLSKNIIELVATFHAITSPTSKVSVNVA